MRILCTNHGLTERGGTESYLETVAPELRALGHEVELFCLHAGVVANRLRERGFVVHDDERGLRSDYDVVHAQHAPTALAVRARLHEVPIVFASHSWFVGIEDPPPEAAPAAVIAFNDLVARRVRASALAASVPVHRLTQPVTIGVVDRGRAGIRGRPREALALSRNLSTRIPALREACVAAGIELTVIGRDDERVEDPTTAMMAVDIVFGSGRTVLEALALGRAGFVYDEAGFSGFVDDTTHPGLEACGFTADPGPSAQDLATLIDGYDAVLGTVGRELVLRHHAAARHAVALVEIYRSVVPGGKQVGPPEALARLARVEQELFEVEHRARGAEWEAVRFHQQLVDAHGQLGALHEEYQARLRVLQGELDAVRASSSWRLTAPLRWRRGRDRRTGGPVG